MTEHPNATRMRKASQAASAGDITAFLEAFSPNCTWRVPGKSDLAGVQRGHDGIGAFFGRMFEVCHGTQHAEQEESLGSDDHVVIFLRVTGETPTGPVDFGLAHFATVGPDGRFDRNWFLPSDLDAFDRMLG
jgi:ketosteroid isomerase-like protein